MIYLVAGSGGPNFGDELIVLKWVAAYRAAGFDDQIVVDCKSVAQSERLHRLPSAGRAISAAAGHATDLTTAWATRVDAKVSFVHVVKSLTKGRGGVFSEHVEAGTQFVRSHLARFTQDATEGDANGVNMARCRIIHLVGGGYINGVWPNSAAILGACAELSRQFDVPLVATGLGLEPMTKKIIGNALTVNEALAQFRVFEVRDQGSSTALQAAGVHASHVRVGLDDSFLFEVPVNRSTGPRTLHISTFERHMGHFVGEAALPRLQQLAKSYERCAFWVCSPTDQPLLSPLRAALGDLEVFELPQLLFGPSVVRAGDCLLTSRFHPHLLAARAGLQGFYFAASPFYRAKHNAVLSLGSPFQDFRATSELHHSARAPSAIAVADPLHRLAKRKLAEEVFALVAGRKQAQGASAPPPCDRPSGIPRARRVLRSLLRDAVRFLEEADHPAVQRIGRRLVRVRGHLVRVRGRLERIRGRLDRVRTGH